MAGQSGASRKRPWGVLVPPPWPLNDFAFVGELLQRFGEDSPVIGCLWSTRRGIAAWSEASPEQRAVLFERRRIARAWTDAWESAAVEVPELASPLDRFKILSELPARATTADLAEGCQIVSQWAEKTGCIETAVQFAEAAATLSPDSALLANAAARACRAKGELGRAEIWYDRAVGLSRRAGDVLQYINANLGFGAVLLERRSFRAAQKKIRRAGTRARQRGMREQAAEAFHDALAVAIVEGDPARAVHFARRAIDVYPRHALRYPALGNDLAYLLTCCGMYREALSLLELAAERITAPAELIVVLGTLARAAAGSGDLRRFTEMVDRVSSMSSAFSHAAAAAFYNIGEGARLLGEWDAAAAYADTAAELALRGNSKQILWLAASLKRAVTERRPTRSTLSRTDPLGQLLTQLADTVHSRLESWRGPTWRPRRS
jgi:tetratricopeptide (TPR) repeat protein